MKVDEKGNTMTLKDTQGDFTSFLMKVTHQYKTYENHNIIIDLLAHKDITTEDVIALLPLSKQHKKAKKSFIVVVGDFDYNAIPTKLTVVPTLLEANDIIDMEEIERDLGF
ncbi:ribonuclease Z [Flavobacterium ovatum]|uniref:ribonuclease Z n=1 Tax=Flavobacterium ovatum TaxID=1928857 RepID=UPI00344D9EE4